MSAPGWYGKVASLGDFASRRLDADFIGRWDAWMQDVIARSQEQLGEAWLDRYLTCAVWRFIERGDDDIHAGVLMPSVDKVGRYFPLCVAIRLPAPPASPAADAALDDLLGALEAAALESLDPGLSANAFDEHLLRIAVPAGLHRRSTDAHARHHGSTGGGFVASAEAGIALSPGCSLWWIGDHPTTNPSSFIVRGLPRSEHFLGMLRATAEPLRH